MTQVNLGRNLYSRLTIVVLLEGLSITIALSCPDRGDCYKGNVTQRKKQTTFGIPIPISIAEEEYSTNAPFEKQILVHIHPISLFTMVTHYFWFSGRRDL